MHFSNLQPDSFMDIVEWNVHNTSTETFSIHHMALIIKRSVAIAWDGLHVQYMVNSTWHCPYYTPIVHDIAHCVHELFKHDLVFVSRLCLFNGMSAAMSAKTCWHFVWCSIVCVQWHPIELVHVYENVIQNVTKPLISHCLCSTYLLGLSRLLCLLSACSSVEVFM